VIADQRQVAMTLAPRDLVDRDLKQIAERSESISSPATRSMIRPISPVDPNQRRSRLVVLLASQRQGSQIAA